MKLYHGSPKLLKTLKPQKAKGIEEFENIKGVFLTKTFLHAALYAIGKTLKGKTSFGVSESKLVILGDLKPRKGYVYMADIKDPIKGPRGQYACEKEVVPISVTSVSSKDFLKNIFYVVSKEELIKELGLKVKC